MSLKRNETEKVRILIADHQPIFRIGILAILSIETTFQCMGEVEDGSEILLQLKKLRPDLLLLDLQLPSLNLIELMAQLNCKYPTLKVLFFSTIQDDCITMDTFKHRTSGLALKDEIPEVLLCAIKRVMQGDFWLSRKIVEKISTSYTEQSECLRFRITPQEINVLQLLARGLSNQCIAKELCISEAGVRFHLKNIYCKTGIRS